MSDNENLTKLEQRKLEREARNNKKNNKRNKGKKFKTWHKVIIGILLVLITIISAAACAGFNLLGYLNRKDINKDNIGITDDTRDKLSKYSHVKTIALYGIDAVGDNPGRSDAIMIVAIDTKMKEVRIASIARDAYVKIAKEGHDMDKINHAYAFGGPEIALKTLNSNFDLNVENYATVNFSTLPQVIDKLGGVTLDIKEDELPGINKYINDVNNKIGTSSPQLPSAGKQTVDGAQALAYLRIRSTAGGDFDRTSRHRELMEAMFKKFMQASVTEYPSLLSSILPLIETNLTSGEILSIGKDVAFMGLEEMKEDRFPKDGYYEGQMINGVYYNVLDIEKTTEQMHKFLFEGEIVKE